MGPIQGLSEALPALLERLIAQWRAEIVKRNSADKYGEYEIAVIDTLEWTIRGVESTLLAGRAGVREDPPEHDDLSRVAPLNDCVASTGSTAEEPTGAVTAAERTEERPQTMADAAEMLWVMLANVSEGNWTKQSADWQEYAARWRDNYFAVLTRERQSSLPVTDAKRTKE